MGCMSTPEAEERPEDERLHYDIFVLRPNGPISHNSDWVIEDGESILIDGQRLEIISTTAGISDGADKSLLCIARPAE